MSTATEANNSIAAHALAELRDAAACEEALTYKVLMQACGGTRLSVDALTRAAEAGTIDGYQTFSSLTTAIEGAATRYRIARARREALDEAVTLVEAAEPGAVAVAA